MSFSTPPARSSRSDRTPRKGRRGLSALLALVLAGPVAASVTATVLPNLGREGLPKDKVAAVPFGAGETLVYTVSWLKIEGGEMTLATSREKSPDGVPVHRIRLSAVSNDYVSRFYPVNTHYETWVDARDFTPVRFEKHAREGRYSSDEVEEFEAIVLAPGFRRRFGSLDPEAMLTRAPRGFSPDDPAARCRTGS
mgnify:CR=1 FL=1